MSLCRIIAITVIASLSCSVSAETLSKSCIVKLADKDRVIAFNNKMKNIRNNIGIVLQSGSLEMSKADKREDHNQSSFVTIASVYLGEELLSINALANLWPIIRHSNETDQYFIQALQSDLETLKWNLNTEADGITRSLGYELISSNALRAEIKDMRDTFLTIKDYADCQ